MLSKSPIHFISYFFLALIRRKPIISNVKALIMQRSKTYCPCNYCTTQTYYFKRRLIGPQIETVVKKVISPVVFC